MAQLICPVCGAPLNREARTLHCERGHGFDLARQGYVNLLTVTQKHSKSPGDTAEQVAARRAFLRAGYYTPIAERVCDLLAPRMPRTGAVLDAGCGEGYYLGCLQARQPELDAWGLDISKEAVRAAAAQNKTANWVVGTAAHLPFADDGFDAVMSMFAMTAPEEYRRVLRPGGCFLQVLAGEAHLMALKRIIYPEIRQKEKVLHAELPGFALAHSETLRFPVELRENAQVMALLSMTPHIYRISAEGMARAQAAQRLSDTAEVVFNLYTAL